MTRSLLLIAALLLPLPAMAAQTLVPSPYPSTSPGTAPLNPTPMGTGVGQSNMATPYPQATGGAAQGNPATVTPGAAQTLAPSTFRQKYGVEQK